jgi:isopentenyldiphosphate isomerase
MDLELIAIFDKEMNRIGNATRDEVHRFGYLHQTFQCWFRNNSDIYLQIRSEEKKDFPGLLDITAAGHLLADESVEDGGREIQEELGLNISFTSLTYLGLIEDTIVIDDIKDYEMANVFLYDFQPKKEKISFNDKEVIGLVKTSIDDLYQLWSYQKDSIMISGYKIDKKGHKNYIRHLVTRSEFVPHRKDYYLNVLEKIMSFSK